MIWGIDLDFIDLHNLGNLPRWIWVVNRLVMGLILFILLKGIKDSNELLSISHIKRHICFTAADAHSSVKVVLCLLVLIRPCVVQKHLPSYY